MPVLTTCLSTLWTCLLLSAHFARAAGPYALPSTWSIEKTKSSLSLAEREGYASRAATLLVGEMTSTLGTIDGFDAARAAELVAVLALQDWLSGNTTNKAAVQKSLDVYETQKPEYPDSSGVESWNSDILYWGLAAYYAHRAYPVDDTYLGLAINNWQLTTQSFIPANGTLPRSSKVMAGCTGKSLAGGVFLVRDAPDDPTIWSFVNGMYITLSSYLYEASGDEDYLSHAEATASFLQTVFFEPGLSPYSVNVTSCAFNTALSSWVSGAAIEGYAVLANVTGNSTWADTLAEILPAAMKSTAPWNTADGRISEDDVQHPTYYQNVLKGMLMRGVLEARRRNPSVSDLVTLVDAYITIQLNSILNATVNGTADTYSTSWIGEQDNPTDLTGNVGALDVLNAAFAIAGSLPVVTGNGSTTGGGSSGSSGGDVSTGGDGASSGAQTSSHSSNVGAIAGGVVGGVAALGLVGIAVFFYRRRRAGTTAETKARNDAMAADPFPPGSSESPGTQSRFDRKYASEGGSQLPTLLGSPTTQTADSPVASSLSLLNTPRPRFAADDASPVALHPNRGLQASTVDAPPTASRIDAPRTPQLPPASSTTDLSPVSPAVPIDPQTIHGLIGQLQGMLRDHEEPPPEYIPRNA